MFILLRVGVLGRERKLSVSLFQSRLESDGMWKTVLRELAFGSQSKTKPRDAQRYGQQMLVVNSASRAVELSDQVDSGMGWSILQLELTGSKRIPLWESDAFPVDE